MQGYIFFIGLFLTITAYIVMSYFFLNIQGSWWSCHFIELSFMWLGIYFGCHSLLVAWMKYYCIVHREKVDDIGLNCVQNRFIVGYLVSLSLFTILYNPLNGNYYNVSMMNKLWGVEEVASVAEETFWDSIKSKLGYYREYGLEAYLGL